MKTLWLALLTTTCTPPWVAPEIPVTPATRICAALERLGCPEARPTREGATCLDVYEDVLAAGVDLAPAAACAEASKTCAAATAC